MEGKEKVRKHNLHRNFMQKIPGKGGAGFANMSEIISAVLPIY